MSNLLFIRSKNQWRSPTAQFLFKNHPLHVARSAGTSGQARIKVNQKLINWADVIYVMENKHLHILKDRVFIVHKKIIVLDIADVYQFNDPELIEILKVGLMEYIS